jgi:hypothetical protein
VEHSAQEWRDIVDKLADGPIPYLAQVRVSPYMFGIAHAGVDGVKKIDVRLVGGVYYRHLSVSSIVARVAPQEVVNAINGAYVLPEVAVPTTPHLAEPVGAVAAAAVN